MRCNYIRRAITHGASRLLRVLSNVILEALLLLWGLEASVPGAKIVREFLCRVSLGHQWFFLQAAESGDLGVH